MRDPGRDVVITGCGLVTALGPDVATSWTGLVEGRVGVAPIAGFPAEDLTPNVAAEVSGFDGPDRVGGLALAATREAIRDAGLKGVDLGGARVGVVIGTTLGAIESFERWAGDEPVDETAVQAMPYFAASTRVARTVGARGPVATPQLACASGTWAVALGALWLRRGQADLVLAGGADALARFVVAGFNALRATAEVARPFDRDRRGLVLGEGAGMVVLERRADAAARGAHAQASVLGLGAAGDATHMTAPDREGRGAARAMRAALDDARVGVEAVGFVSAHGTGTAYNDAMEARALREVFGAGGPAVNSIKGSVGHTLGAAGAIEVVASVCTLREGLVPPTAGLCTVDPACEGLDLVAKTARRRTVDIAVSTSSGFGGANAALVLGRSS